MKFQGTHVVVVGEHESLGGFVRPADLSMAKAFLRGCLASESCQRALGEFKINMAQMWVGGRSVGGRWGIFIMHASPIAAPSPIYIRRVVGCNTWL